MKTTVLCKKINTWSDLNDVEGDIECRIGEFDIFAKVFLLDNDIRKYENSILEGFLFLERSGSIEILNASSIDTEMIHENGVNYCVIGRVFDIEGELLKVHSTIDLTIDIDLTDKIKDEVKNLKIGDLIRVTGVLKFDINL